MHQSGIYFGDDTDYSSFHYTTDEIKGFEESAREIEQYFLKPITEENFNSVFGIWYKLVSQIPLPAVPIREKFILRARPSKELEIFEDESDMSYNTKCPEKINPGRFNRPIEPVFYGVLPSNEQEKFVNAATIESYKELISHESEQDVVYFHLCKFNIVKPFAVVNLCFEQRVVNIHPGLRRIVTAQTSQISQKLPVESANAIFRFWNYVSAISSVRKLCEQHYMVSTALFCAIRTYYETTGNILVNGIIYPSPMVYGNAVNIALIPEAVDNFLEADDCFLFKYIRGEHDPKSFQTDICSKPSKVTNKKLNITHPIWGRTLSGYQ